MQIKNDALYTELDSFKKLVRYIAKHCMTDEQKELFTQGESSMKHRLTTIGITGHVPAIQGNLILTEKKAATVSKSMFKIRNGTTKKATTAYFSMCDEIEKNGNDDDSRNQGQTTEEVNLEPYGTSQEERRTKEDVKGNETPSCSPSASERRGAWAVQLGSVQEEHPEEVNSSKVADGGYLSSDPQCGTARAGAFLVLQWPLMLKSETAVEFECPTQKTKDDPKDVPNTMYNTKKYSDANP